MDERNALALMAGIGIALGAGIGAAMDNIALGIGIAIGAGLGAAFMARGDEDGRN